MSRIVIGKSGGKNVALDLEVLLATRALLTADSGGGKTYALKRICEQAFGKIQIIIIDPEGEFSPLRESLDFVLVGKGGETPADIRSAALVAHTLMKLRVSAICDIFELKPAERHAWVRAFLTALIEAPKETRHPCLVIVDEAHMFCPEKGKGESEASDAMRDLCTRGRKRLLCPLFATQRLATLSKDASSMLLNRMIGPTFEDLNRKRAADILSITKEDQREFFKQIQTLEPGNFFCLGRAISKERILAHIGPIISAHGQEALKYEMKPPPAPDKIKALLPKLADLPKEAEEQAKTVAEFKAEIRSLKAQLRSQPVQKVQQISATPAADRGEIQRAVRPLRALLEEVMKVIVKVNAIGFDGTAVKPEEIHKALEATAKEISRLAKAGLEKRAGEFERLKKETNRLLLQMKQALAQENVTVNVDVKHNEPFTVKVPAPRGRPAGGDSNGDLRSSERTVLRAVAQYEGGVERDQLSVLTGYKRSTRDTYIARLRTKGLVDDRSGKIMATEEGISALGHAFEPLPEGEELQRYWRERLPKGERELFEILLGAEGGAVSRESLTEQTGYKRSTRDTYLARMTARRIVEPMGRGEVKAVALLFT